MNSRGRPAFDWLDSEWYNAHLQHGMISLQELDEAWHDTTLDDLFDWRVFLLGQQLPEFCRGVQLARRVIGENTLNHLFGQLIKKEKKRKVRTWISLYVVYEGSVNTYVRYDGIAGTRAVLVIGVTTASRK
jgi:hypothetical protein